MFDSKEIINDFKNKTKRVKAGNINRKGAISKEMAHLSSIRTLPDGWNDNWKKSNVVRISSRIVKRVA